MSFSLVLASLIIINGFSHAFLINEGDANEIMSEVALLREEIAKLTTQVKSSCGCATSPGSRCPDGWTMFSGSCYYFGVVPKSWQDSEVACERLGGHLATVHSTEEEQFILDYVKRERKALVDMSHGYTWIGGHDFLQESNWMWITDEVFNFTNWRAGNPNNGGAALNEDCLDVSGDGWNDNKCSNRLNYVCERNPLKMSFRIILTLLFTFDGFSGGFLINPGDGNEILAEVSQLREMLTLLTAQVKSSCGCATSPGSRCPDGWTMFSGSCYYFGVVPKSWQDSEVACERLGGHLATVHSTEEEQFILDYAKREKKALVDMSHGYTWIGGHDFLQESNWMWITDEVFNFTNWRAGNPSNGNGNEDCLDLSFDGWNDNTCSNILNYICERNMF
ncbi:uncharacterized protein LOC125654833 [Ostrea edulis]|uniref:uncharacterized protein LOC125654833 n=1 Tax=Ostrea edulis TaxID=37623 RepID=UPI0024AF5B00|nr:uncharacterized protein LOC125654833 [Ostrea edulis]